MIDPRARDFRRFLSRVYRRAADEIRDHIAKSRSEYSPAWFEGGKAAADYIGVQRAFEIEGNDDIGWALRD